MIYYIDPICGRADADGLSPENARRDYRDLTLNPGDSVLFRRGSFIRDRLYRKAGDASAPITYGAYGEGENPVFCGSVDVSNPVDWTEIRPNVWQYGGELPIEACNFIFDLDDGTKIGGTLRWEEEFLCAPRDWYDSRMGCKEQRRPVAETKVLVWCEGNPAVVHKHIECAVFGGRNLSDNVPYTVTEDLCFFGSGVHGMSGGSHHMVIRRCSFLFIGGCVWNRNLRIRFGNAIEFWNTGHDILIEDCYFNQIYDSAITHQGSASCEPARNLVMRNNFFAAYGMGAYEGRDRMSIDSAFNDNLCYAAGAGFSGFGDTSPRNSEIYPQPMGHHLFMWRIPEATEGGSLEVARNRFYDATGAAMYSIISPEAEAQMHLHDNVYFTANESLFNHMSGTSYAPAEFERYLTEQGESGAVMRDAMPDIEAEAAAWFKTSGCGGMGVNVIPAKLPVNKCFIGGTERDPMSFRVGEGIRFHLTLTHEGKPAGCPLFRYVRKGDDGIREEGICDGTSGTFTYAAKTDLPGTVRLTVTPCDADGQPLPDCDPFEGGVCVNADQITASAHAPADFDDWWQQVIRDELDPVAPETLEKVPFSCGDPGDNVFDVKIDAPGPNPVSGYLRIPKNAAEKSLPVSVSYMGYSVAGAPIPTKANAIQLCINPHGIPNGRPYAYYRDLEREIYGGFGFDREQNKNPDTVYFKYVILRALQAIRWCKTLPEWDGTTVILNGGSMGAFQAAAAAALTPGVTKLNLQIPWLCDLHGRDRGKLGGWRPDSAIGLDYYDTVSFGARVTCETAIAAALGDDICPPTGVTALYNAIAGPKTLEMRQNRTHSRWEEA